MSIDPGVAAALTAIVVPVVAGLVWMIRLEGWQKGHEAVCNQRQTDLDRRLESIEGKLDRLVEHRK